jgi:hypothetical protein
MEIPVERRLGVEEPLPPALQHQSLAGGSGSAKHRRHASIIDASRID